MGAQATNHDQHGHGAQRDNAIGQRQAHHGQIERVQPGDDPGFLVADPGRQEQAAQRRRDGEGGYQPTGDGVGIGLRHRAENMAFDAAERE